MANGGVFDRGLMALERLGLSDIILPFLLIFTIVFAVLEKSKILGEDSKKFNTMIAMIMGLMVVIPHSLGLYPGGRDVVNIINTALPNISVVLVAAIMVLLLIGVFGWELKGEGMISGFVGIFAFAVVLFIFGAAANWWQIPTALAWLNDPDLQALVIILLVFGIVVKFITTEEDEKREGFVERLGKLIK